MKNGLISVNEKIYIDNLINEENTIILNHLIEKNMIQEKLIYQKKWMEPIYARYLLHKLNATNQSFQELKNIDSETFTFKDFQLDIVQSSENIESLLQFIFHPDYDHSGGLKIGFQNSDEKDRFYENLLKALELIAETDIDAFEMITSILQGICPVYTGKSLKKGDVISFTLNYSMGLIFYSPSPTILTAETIIHETRHNVLNLMLKKYNYLTDNEIKIKTPLREDLRPLLGLIHQAYVLCGLTNFYRLLLKSEPYKEMANVQKRYALHLDDYTEAIRILENNKNYLTNEGISLLAELTFELISHE